MTSKKVYIKGYYLITLTNGNYARFITICKNHGVRLFDIKYYKEKCTFKVYYNDLSYIEKISQKNICDISISECKGVTGKIQKYRYRITFFAGVILCALILVCMQRRMWSIKIYGNTFSRDENIIMTLKENNVYRGMSKNNLSCENIEKVLRHEYPCITWVSAEIRGTILILNIKENDIEESTKEKDLKINSKITYDIIAAYDGRIYDMVTINGTPQVKNGQMIKKGDVLVKGELEIYNDNAEIERVRNVEPKAIITGVYEYDYYDEMEDKLDGEQSKSLICNKYYHFLLKLKEKGIQIIGKNVTIDKVGRKYRICGKLKLKGELGIMKKREIKEDIFKDERN